MKRKVFQKNEFSKTIKKYFLLEQDENEKIKILINLSNNKNKQNEIISLNLTEIKNETETIITKFNYKKTSTSFKKKSSKLEENKELKGFYFENICVQLLK